QDIFTEIDPRSSSAPLAKEGWTLPVQNTLPDINPDEVFSALDADTRDYLKLLINGAGKGLDKRGTDLQEVFARFEPTYRDIAKVTSQVKTRRANLRRLINSLQRLDTELASRDDDLAQLVSASATVFRAFASENTNISRAVRNFPGALRQRTNPLGKGHTTRGRGVGAATAATPPSRALAGGAEPILRKRIRPFVRAARPLARD